MLENPVGKLKPEDFSDVYLGTVVSNDDPDNLMRVKVRIEEIYGTNDQVLDSDLPWAVPVNPPGLGAIANVGWFGVPRVGSKVFIKFHKGNIYVPMYIGSPTVGGSRNVGSVFTNKDTWGFRDSAGNYIQVDMSSGVFKVHVEGDHVLEVTGDGSVNVSGNLSVNVTGDASVTVGGNTSIDSTGNISATTDGNVAITAAGSFTMISSGLSLSSNGGNSTFTCTGTATITADQINITDGSGTLKGVARLGDTVQVGSNTGTITSASSILRTV